MTILALALGLLLPAAAPLQTPPDALDKLLAPIALYPDQLLSPMLLCAGKPAKLGALDEWLAARGESGGSALQDAATKAGFDAACVALVPFPDIVHSLASQPQWTAQVGEAFAADRSAVFASIQRLRAKAKQVGNLKTTPQQSVETKKTSSGDEVIVIEPSNPQVVYVPQYNATTVYTQPATTSTTVVIQEDDDDATAAIVGGMVGFTAGVAIGAAFDNNYYYGPYGMYGGAYMYNDAWDDWYDDREDAREDWYDNREDLAEERTERREDLSEERTDRRENASENRTERTENRSSPESQAQREQRRSDAQTRANEARSSGATAGTTSTGEQRTRGTSQEARGYSGGERTQSAGTRSGTKSDAFSGYSSGRSERSASSRGQRSRSGGGSRGGGGGRRR